MNTTEPTYDFAINSHFKQFKDNLEQTAGEHSLDDLVGRLEEYIEKPDKTRFLRDNVWLYTKLGSLYRKQGRESEAIDAYEQAFEYDPRHPNLLIPYAELLLENSQQAEAVRVLQQLLVHDNNDLSSANLSWVYEELAKYYQSEKQLEKAQYAFERAAQESSKNETALEGLLAVTEEVGEPKDVIDVRRRLLDARTDSEVRAQTLHALGDDWRRRLNDLQRALQTYEEAHIEDPTNLEILVDIAQTAEVLKKWGRAAEAYRELARRGEAPEAKADYLVKASRITKTKQWEPEAAVDDLREALRHDPTRLDAFEAMTSVLGDAQNWSGLEKAYQTLIDRNKELDNTDPELLGILYKKLGQLYMRYLEEPELAFDAFRNASEHDNDDLETLEQLVELAKKNEAYEIALDKLETLIEKHPQPAPLLVELGDIYELINENVWAAHAYQAASYLGADLPSPAESAVEEHLTPLARFPSEPLERSDINEYILPTDHPDVLDVVFATLGNALFEWVGEDPGTFGLSTDDKVDLDDELAFNNLYKEIAEALGASSPPDLWFRSDQPDLVNLGLVPKGLVVGEQLLRGSKEKVLAFAIAKQQFLLNDSYYLLSIRPADELKALARLILSIQTPEFKPESIGDHAQDALERIEKNLDTDSEQQLEEIGKALELERLNALVDTWIETTETAANRIGLLFSDSPDAAREALELEQNPLSERSIGQRAEELALYSTNRKYLKLLDILDVS